MVCYFSGLLTLSKFMSEMQNIEGEKNEKLGMIKTLLESIAFPSNDFASISQDILNQIEKELR